MEKGEGSRGRKRDVQWDGKKGDGLRGRKRGKG